MSVTSVRISEDIEAPLESLAKRLDRSKNYIINQAIKEFIARQLMEDGRWEDTLKALSSVREGRLIEEAEVSKWLQSWGTDDEITPPAV